jgi:hypothetical protein
LQNSFFLPFPGLSEFAICRVFENAKNFLYHIGRSPDLFKSPEPAKIRFYPLFSLGNEIDESVKERIFEPHQQVHFSLLAVCLSEALAIGW